MEELNCSSCNCHLGWISYSGPIGLVYCDDCEEEDSEEVSTEGL